MVAKLIKSDKLLELSSEVELSGDKSCAIRALIFTSLFASGNVKIHNLPKSGDVNSVLNALNNLKSIKKDNRKENIIDLGNSRTGLVFVLAYAIAKNLPIQIVGDESLSKRNMQDILEVAEEFGCVVLSNDNYLPLKLISGISKCPKSIICNGSAQQKSFARILALFSKKEVDIIEREKSRDHTENLLQYMGISRLNHVSTISDIDLASDPSSAAFIIIYAILSKQNITIKNLCLNKFRTGYLELLSECLFIDNIRMQAGELVGDVHIEPQEIKAFDTSRVNPNRLIDEYPIIAVLACFAKGESRIWLPDRLINKESNRIDEIIKILDAFFVSYELNENILSILGRSFAKNQNIKFNSTDHRILMSATIMALLTNSSIELENYEMINSSFPEFFDVISS